MSYRMLRRCALAAPLLITGAMPVSDARADDQDVQRLDALTVTAGKRDQALGQIDSSVTVRTAEELAEAGVTRLDDLDRVFPGLVIRARGNRAYTGVTIRGVTSPDFYNPAVQVYVDGVPQDAAAFAQELVNVERVELLRGPQGTLYGRNAHGGVINVITRMPTNRLKGHASVTLGVPERGAEAVIAGPVVPDRLAAELALRWSQDQGQIDDVATGRTGIDDGISRMARLKLRHAPVDSPLAVTVTASREELESHEELYIRDASVDDRRYDSASQGARGWLDRRVTTLALAADYDLSDAASLSSITSWQSRDLTRVITVNTPESQDQISQELRLAFQAGERLDGVLGGFFQSTEFTRTTPGYPGYYGPDRNEVDTRSYAVFGEATYALTPVLDLTGGLRWSREQAEIRYDRPGSGPFDYRFRGKDDFSDISPKLALGWQVAPDHRLRAVIARGFKPGGFNHTVASPDDAIPYDSETSTNYELGWRGGMAGGRLDLDAAVYLITALDKQIYTGPLGAQVLRNMGDALSHGIELDGAFRATTDLTLRAGATIGRSEFDGGPYDGRRLPYAPDTTLRAGLRWIVPQTSVPGAVAVDLNANWVDRTWFDEANTLSQSAYTLLDAAVEVDLDAGYAVRVFARNLTDEVYRTSSFDFGGGDIRSTLGDGRTIGITGSWRF
ncbi:TonB-dependent receptor [Tistrella bauzanensis]|uniref:TonB-dependent receptor n=1 Tax=Tistrella bauzanensis TaxID=657419 RepID=A0ABQ1IZS4_9PROT|nr:TonB-dependent receptor [Tistrella bauzanensis]GGB56040.1 TonB-dependent receptor [Tistrella bauzanensis]